MYRRIAVYITLLNHFQGEIKWFWIFIKVFGWLYKDSWNWNFFLRWCNSIPETGGNWIKKFIFGCLFSAFRIKTYSCLVIFIVKVIYWRSYRYIYFSLKFFCFFTIFKVVYTKNYIYHSCNCSVFSLCFYSKCLHLCVLENV